MAILRPTESFEKIAYRSPSDTARESFLTSLAKDLRLVGHNAKCERSTGGVTLYFKKADLETQKWKLIYRRIRDRSLRENKSECAFILEQEKKRELLDLFLDGTELKIEKIKPELVILGQGQKSEFDRSVYRYCRHMQSVPTSHGKGRRVHALLYDVGQGRKTLMGAFCLASPGYTQGRRDAFLEWNEIDSRNESKRVRELGLRRMMQLSVCIAIPPYRQLHCLKLLALLTVSDPVTEAFFQAQLRAGSAAGERLLAVITTSAFDVHAAGFDRIQLPKIKVADQAAFERNQLFKRLKEQAPQDPNLFNAAPPDGSRDLPPVSTMICSASTVQAARELSRFILGNGHTESKPMRSEHDKDRSLMRALSVCRTPKHVLGVNEKGTWFGTLSDEYIEVLRHGSKAPRDLLKLPVSAAIDYWRSHILPKAQRQSDFVTTIDSIRSKELLLGRILRGRSIADET